MAFTVYSFGVVGAGYLVLSRYDRIDQLLSRQISVLYLLVAIVAACAAAGISGAIMIGPLFGEPITVSAFLYWFTGELWSQLAFLPMILSFPQDTRWKWQIPQFDVKKIAPVILLALTAVLGIFSAEWRRSHFPYQPLFGALFPIGHSRLPC